MTPFGHKSVFLWSPSAVHADPGEIVKMLTGAGFEAVYLHAESFMPSVWRHPARLALIPLLHREGIKLYASGAVYGANVLQEAKQAAEIVTDYGLDGAIFDAEAKFDAQPNAAANAALLIGEFKRLTAKPVGWCWWAHYKEFRAWRVPSNWHPEIVLKTAMQYADAGLPMAYWWTGDKPEQAQAYLDGSLDQWSKHSGGKPLCPIGRAYNGDGGNVTSDNIRAFEARARERGCAGVSWWSMQHAVKLPGVWTALGGLPGCHRELTLEQRVKRLEEMHEIV